MFKLIKDLTRPPEALTPLSTTPSSGSATPHGAQARTRPRSRLAVRGRSQSPAVPGMRAKSPGTAAFSHEPGHGERDPGDSGWSFAFDAEAEDEEDEDETEESAIRVVGIIRALRNNDKEADAMLYVENFAQLLSIPSDFYTRQAFRRHHGTRTLFLALNDGLAWEPKEEEISEEEWQVKEVQRKEGVRLAFEVLSWALGDRVSKAHFERNGGYQAFLPVLYRLVPPSGSPNFPNPQILAQLFAHVCSNNYSFTALFESPEISLSNIPSRIGDIVVCSSTSGALKLLWSYLQGESPKGKCREHIPLGDFEGKEDSEEAKLVQLFFQVLLIIVKTSIPNLFTVAFELPNLSEFLLERLYGPEQKRKYAITFPRNKDPGLKEESEEEEAVMKWQGPDKELRPIYLALLKRMLEASVDQKVTWRLFGLVRRTNEDSKPIAVGTPASAVFTPETPNSTSPSNLPALAAPTRGKPNLHINTIDTTAKDDESLYPEVLDLIRHAVKSKWSDVFVFEGGCGDNLGGLELEELGRPWMNGHKGFNFSCWIHISKLNQPLTLLHLSQKGSGEPLFQIRILENSQIAITSTIHSPSSPIKPSHFPNEHEVICSAPDALIPHFQWVHFALGCRKPHGQDIGEIRIFINGIRVGAMRMPFPVPSTTPPIPVTQDTKHDITAGAIRLSIGKEYQGGVVKKETTKEGSVGREEENEWMLGRVLFLEEAVPEDLVLLMHHLGPRYTGNLQEPMGRFLTYEGATSINIYLHRVAQSAKDKRLFTHPSSSILVRAIRSGYVLPEESIILSLSAKDYDLSQDVCVNGAIPHPYRAKQLRYGIVKLLGNVQPFKSTNLDESVQAVGGGLVILKMIAISQTKEELLATLGILRDAIKDSWSTSEEMERIHGFDLLAAILRPKAAMFLDEACTKTIMAMLGINMDKPGSATVHNSVAYRALGLEFELWSYASDDVIRYYLQHFKHLLVTSKHKRFNILRTFQKSAMVKKMLYTLRSGLFAIEVVPDVVDTLRLALEARWSGENGIKPIFSYLVSALCQNNMAFSVTVSNEPPPYQLPAALILAKLAELCHNPTRLTKLNRSVALHRLLVIFLSSNSSPFVVYPCLDLLQHCFTTPGLETFQRSFESEGGFALLARILPPVWTFEIQVIVMKMVLGDEPEKRLLSPPMVMCLLAALDWLLQMAGDSEEGGGRPQVARTRSGTMSSVRSITAFPPSNFDPSQPDDRLKSLLQVLTGMYRAHPNFRKSITYKKIENLLPNIADFAAVSGNGRPDIVQGQREAVAGWLAVLVDEGKLPKAVITQMSLLIEQLKTIPSSPKISSSLAMSPTSPPTSSYFGQSFTSRLGTSTGVASPLLKRRPSTDAGMPGFTRSRSIREQWVPLKRVLTGESILEGGKDKNEAWKMIIIQTDFRSHAKMTLERKEHWQKLSQFDWPQQAATLRAENGLWQESNGGVTWRLDGSEGPLRMRARLERVDNVPEPGITRARHKLRDAIPSVDELSSAVSRINSAPWEDPFALALGDTAPVEEEMVPTPIAGHDSPGNPQILNNSSSTPASDAVSENGEEESFVEIEERGDDKMRKIAKSLRPGDIVEEAHNIVRIVGVDACPGLLILGKKNLYLINGLVQTPGGEVIDAKDAQKDVLSIPSGTLVELDPDDQQSHCWPYNEIIENNKRAFLFRDVALELYFSDKRNFLVVFRDKKERQAVVQKISGKKDHRDVISKSVIGNFVLDTVAKAMDKSEQQLEALQRKWQNREISNFAYLQLLNQYANRTPNDVTQYPVFPWVIADYSSDHLDLRSESSFRNLRFPMGALTLARREEAMERYTATESVGEKPFHYGTHYSSSMIVCGYMIRLSPFTEIFLALQGGNFDLADRLFSSVPRAWVSASSDNRGDVRELIPEFFYSPAFLMNLNHHNFGRKQVSGEAVDDVALPPWALGDPHLFIHRHREALESDYVSRHLASWIDLTFGYKQRDPAAFNCFHPLSYRGAVDLENIENEEEKAASTAIIHNFGQTPNQIFKSPHPHRFLGGQSDLPLGVRFGVAEHWQLMLRSILPITESITSIDLIDLPSGPDTKPKLSQRYRLSVPGSSHLTAQYGFVDGSVRIYYQDVVAKLVYLCEGIYPVNAVFASSSLFLTVSSLGVITAWRINVNGAGYRRGDVTMQREATLRGHSRPVTCLAANTSWSILVSGAENGDVMVWDTNRLRYIRTLQTEKKESIEFCAINEADGLIAVASRKHLFLFSLNGHQIASISIGDCISSIESDTESQMSEEPYEDDFTGGIAFLNREFLKFGALFVIGVGARIVLFRCAPGEINVFNPGPTIPWALIPQGVIHRSDDHDGGDCCSVKFIGETLYAAFNPSEGKKKFSLYQWSLPDGHARHVADSASHICMAGTCTRHFGLLEPKRHCGGCGGAFCGTHALHVETFTMRYCDSCRAQLSIASAQGFLNSRRDNLMPPSGQSSRRPSISYESRSGRPSFARTPSQPGSSRRGSGDLESST
ncbi:hypothetical protein C343_06613 [Cryptococcus neoformans C23]|uniref:Beach-domain-containing protein n=1 Tax=Cryptococcus neoformans (strain H99 / ATCC 208821 / CBS 10515 / FGSC 9487) TaxID=235443 RepID=J9VYV8_CRYN9|nr:hypothetical protein CNAG_07936 [Cryptococcus neoformans var. grubii H99]AFR98636.2 hypothetical protein CNAG_07936 [Cryptococcus neoformans var. grubii H99]AUB28809.1 hypothetical protein CKF44_07936 [Cryptococcus neoformans var. grubii]OWZ26962.1 hypothetical protein C347_06611 [Cryptococcus neoformans var. grubii AD2-60a]OWZ38823.1 hypothetical protein C343_06613 [Cryptococcus neoformans var. grubii C23]|eukprot:XP_012053318.1 hypothetical protein CNAG_07936 [Cryptococcus neoformans var. grubii H99]